MNIRPILFGLLSGVWFGMVVSEPGRAEIPTNTLFLVPSPLPQTPTKAPKRFKAFSSSLEDNSLPDDNPLGEITNVSELRDVSPGDWAYEALRSLIERYQCISGYASGFYLGNHTLSRYEFAGGLNTCLDALKNLLQNKTAIIQEDLDQARRLAQMFEQELGVLGNRIDNLEARTAILEDHQFSPTTKLFGYSAINVTGASASGTVLAEGTQARGFSLSGPSALRDPATGFTQPLTRQVQKSPSITMSTLSLLTLTTSFSGGDALITTLASGNGNSPPNFFGSAGTYNNFPVPFSDQTPRAELGDTNVIISELYYRFPLTDRLQIGVGPAVNYYSFFDFNPYTVFINGTSSFQSIEHPLVANIKQGAGVVFAWKMSDQFSLSTGYLAQNTSFLPNFLRTASDPQTGLFGGTNSVITELTYSPADNANIRLLYGYTNVMPNPIGQSQPLWSIHGVADDGPGGAPQGGLGYSQIDVFALNFDWTLNNYFGIFGRYNYAITHLNPTSNVPKTSINAQAFQFGLAFPNLGKEGSMGTLSFVMPFNVLSGRDFLVSGGGNGGSQYNIEAAYFYPITNRLSIVPAFYVILNPNNFDNNPAIYVTNLRTQFTF